MWKLIMVTIFKGNRVRVNFRFNTTNRLEKVLLEGWCKQTPPTVLTIKTKFISIRTLLHEGNFNRVDIGTLLLVLGKYSVLGSLRIHFGMIYSF